MAPSGESEPPGGQKQISGSGHCWRLAPGGKGSSARRYGIAEILEVQWRLATQDRCARRWRRVAPDGVVEFTRRWRCSDDAAGAWRVAVCDARQAVWTQCLLGDVGCAPSGFVSVMVHEERFLHSFRWCSWCKALAGGPVMSVTCIGVTRDHSRL